jgi:hypothetical protein
MTVSDTGLLDYKNERCAQGCNEMVECIGNKNTFAIEFEVEIFEPYCLGKILIWISNNSIGTWHDTAMLGVVLNELHELKNNPDKYRFIEFEGLTKEDIFELVKGDSNFEGFHLHLGDTFDDFSMTANFKDSGLEFIWQLDDDPFFIFFRHTKSKVK